MLFSLKNKSNSNLKFILINDKRTNPLDIKQKKKEGNFY